MVDFEWDAAKSAWLGKERGISFEEVEEALAAGSALADFDNPGHAGQFLLIVRIRGMIWRWWWKGGERVFASSPPMPAANGGRNMAPKKMRLDAFEQRIEREIERGEWKPANPSRLREIQEAARRSVAERKAREAKDVQVNLRLNRQVVEGLKARAEEVGIPYQTLASAVLRQLALGKLEFRLVKP